MVRVNEGITGDRDADAYGSRDLAGQNLYLFLSLSFSYCNMYVYPMYHFTKIVFRLEKIGFYVFLEGDLIYTNRVRVSKTTLG